MKARLVVILFPILMATTCQKDYIDYADEAYGLEQWEIAAESYETNLAAVRINRRVVGKKEIDIRFFGMRQIFVHHARCHLAVPSKHAQDFLPDNAPRYVKARCRIISKG